MSALPHNIKQMSEDEYLAFERGSEGKHEYINGDVFAMTGASQTHNLICAYTIATLINKLGDKPCEVYPSDMRLKVAQARYTYPDISIVCGDSEFADDTFDTLLNPIVLLEVLSPSTANYDRTDKFRQYRKLSSLKEYLLIAQDSPHIEHYLRQPDNTWALTDIDGLDAQVELASIGCNLALADIYRKVTFVE